MEPILLSIPDACRVLGIGRSKLYELINAGRLDIVKIGRRTLIRAASIRVLAENIA
jgi:excisionase family DNA binding protein